MKESAMLQRLTPGSSVFMSLCDHLRLPAKNFFFFFAKVCEVCANEVMECYEMRRPLMCVTRAYI